MLSEPSGWSEKKNKKQNKKHNYFSFRIYLPRVFSFTLQGTFELIFASCFQQSSLKVSERAY